MTKINLTELNYDNIRSSLLSYLSKQETVKDLNFEGSAVNFLLDLLAYNTLFYAHYANMIANEAFLDSAQLEKTIVSLVKPLGYVVPTKTSSIAKIQLKNVLQAGPIEPYTVSVTGTTPEGVGYQFWNIDSINVNPATGFSDEFDVYQGVYTSLSYGGDGFDFPNQQILISDLNMDIRTIRVSVLLTDADEYTTWERYDLYSGMFVNSDTEIYTIERNASGFVISFGGSVGRQLVSGDKVKIEYLSSSGTLANNCSAFRILLGPSGSSITTILTSKGGLDSPDLDEVRKNAPLSFSAQQRLVTAEDYLSYLSELGVSNAKVWGGETNSPPVYGRVLYSFSSGGGLAFKSTIRNKIRNRSVVTIIPEFVTPSTIQVLFPLKVRYDSSTVTHTDANLETIKQNILDLYPSETYDLVFSKQLVKNAVELQTGYYLNEDAWYIKLQQGFIPQETSTTINFKTEINRYTSGSIAVGSGITSKLFTSPLFPGKQVFIQDVPIQFSGSTNPPKVGTLKLYSQTSAGQIDPLEYTVGKIDYSTGIVTINGVISTGIVYLQAKPVNQNQYVGKDEIYVSPFAEIEEATPL